MSLDEGQNFTLGHNDEPLPVLPEQDQYLELGGTQTNGHLCAITWRGNAVHARPTTRQKYYYEVALPAEEFTAYMKSVDGSPNTVLCALLI